MKTHWRFVRAYYLEWSVSILLISVLEPLLVVLRALTTKGKSWRDLSGIGGGTWLGYM